MATDFFIQQGKARQRTGLLVVLFLLAVLGIIVTVYIAAVAAMATLAANTSQSPQSFKVDEVEPYQPSLFLAVSSVTCAVVGLGSLFKISQLAAGGESVALLLGGKRINANSATDLHEKRVLNVVEEMAIAAGVPVPPVFVMEEKGINAFAAGHKPSDAVIGVTRGTVELLNRDELQGVIAHEFSHILNGDMRLNVRLMGLIHGIVVISMIGYVIVRTLGRSTGGSRKKEGGAILAIVLFGFALMIIGWLGSFFGQLIRAAVSRQREYLADASAVQFTRNPEGIAGALKKIGGWASGSRIEQPQAAEVSHMFFSQALTHSFAQMFATHPPLEKRIRLLDPHWDGKYPKVRVEAVEEAPAAAKKKSRRGPIPFPIDLPGLPGHVGELGVAQLAGAAAILGEMPERVTEAVRDPFSAVALVYAMLIDSNPDVERVQWAELGRGVPAPVLEETKRLVYYVRSLPRESRLPAVEMLLPTLKMLSKPQYIEIRKNAIGLIRADRRVSLFELVVQLFAIRCLDKHFGLHRPGKLGRRQEGREELCIVLAFIARSGASEVMAAEAAYRAAWSAFGTSSEPSMPTSEEVTQSAFLGALDRLESASMDFKKRVLVACAACISADREVTIDEYELVRAIASVLECPLPPIQTETTSE